MSHLEEPAARGDVRVLGDEIGWPRYVVGAVTVIKLLQAVALIVVADGQALPLVPEVASDEAWRSLLLPSAGLILVTMRPSFMAWGVCVTLFGLSLVSQLSDFEASFWVAISVIGSIVGIVALVQPEALRWWRRLL